MDDERLETVLRLALADPPDLRPTRAEVQAVLRGARRPRRRVLPALGLPLRPIPNATAALAAVAVALVVALGTTLAVPPARAALFAAFDRIERFFGGGEAPGRPLPPNEPPDVLNWLGDATAGSPRALARRDGDRLVAFRDRGTGAACFSLGLYLNECAGAESWRARFVDGVLLPLTTTPADASGRVALWGVATDVAVRVELRYADGGVLAARVPANGFVLLTEPARRPRTLVARDAAGAVVARADVSSLPYGACTDPNGCP